MKLLFIRFFRLAARLSTFALPVSLLIAGAVQRVAASALPHPRSRQVDSARVGALVHEAEYIVKWNEYDQPVTRLRLSEQKLLQLTARELQSWANKYLTPFQKREVVALRYFKYLVMTGRYYATAGDFALALNAYKQAEAVIPAKSPLRAKAGKYAKELVAYKKRVEELAVKHPPGDYEYASITMHLTGSAPPLPSKTSDENAGAVDWTTRDSQKVAAKDDGWGTPITRAPASLVKTIKMVKVLVAPYPLKESDRL